MLETETERRTRFTELYATHAPAVYAYLVSRAGRQLADDAFSQTFLVAWRRFAGLPPDPLPWLLSVARNVLRESYRASTRSAVLRDELIRWADDQPLSTDPAEQVVARAETLRALAELPDTDRELLTLVAWDGLDPGQAAQVLGCSKATYFVRLHRARRRLERALAATTTELDTARHPRTASQEGKSR